MQAAIFKVLICPSWNVLNYFEGQIQTKQKEERMKLAFILTVLKKVIKAQVIEETGVKDKQDDAWNY